MEALYGGLEIDERPEHAARAPSLAELGEDTLDSIEPRGRFWCVVEHETRMAIEPSPHFGMFVAPVIVKDNVDHLARRVSPSIVLSKRMNS